MTVKIINRTKRNIDIWLEILGPKYWDNNVEPDGEREHHPGWVWYDLKAKVHTGPNEEITTGMAAVGGILPFAGIIPGVIFKTLIATDAIRNSELLPKDLKKYLDTDSIAYDENSKIQPCEWTNIYGGGDDKTFEIHGGDITYTKQDDGKYKASLSGLSISKTAG